jgi:hypothetical protein
MLCLSVQGLRLSVGLLLLRGGLNVSKFLALWSALLESTLHQKGKVEGGMDEGEGRGRST